MCIADLSSKRVGHIKLYKVQSQNPYQNISKTAKDVTNSGHVGVSAYTTMNCVCAEFHSIHCMFKGIDIWMSFLADTRTG
jgi:hypothetical protein